MKDFLKVFYLLIVGLIITLIDGFVFQTLWGWFIVPTFLIHPLTLVQAVGICLIVGFLKVNYNKKDEETIDTEFILKVLFMSIFVAMITLGSGMIINLLM